MSQRPPPTPAPHSRARITTGPPRSPSRLVNAGGCSEEPLGGGGPAHLRQPHEARREQAAHEEQHELAERAVVGGEVAAVEHGEAEGEAAGGTDDDLDRGAGPRPAGLDPQSHGGLVAGRLGKRAQQLAEALGLVLGGEHQGGDDEVAGRVGHLVGKGPQCRREPLAFQTHRQGDDLGPDRQRRHGGGGDDGLLQPGRAGHGVAAASRPTRPPPRSARPLRCVPWSPASSPGAPQPARPAHRAPTGQRVAAPTTTAAPTASPSRSVARSTLGLVELRIGPAAARRRAGRPR